MDNLRKVKKETIAWAHEKRLKEDQELLNIEMKLLDWQIDPDRGFHSMEVREEITKMELRRTILAEK